MGSDLSDYRKYGNFEIIEDDELSSLGAPLWMEMDLERTIDWMTNEIVFKVENRIERTEKTYVVPRFGVYSTLLEKIPCYIYGDEFLKQKWGNTAFTDGLHIFICADFYKQLVEDEDSSNGKERGIVIVLLHELCHILNEDVYRLRNYDSYIANIAQDYMHNTIIRLEFSDLIFAKSLVEYAVGFAPGDIEKYPYLSQEIVAEEIFNKIKQEKKEEDEHEKPEQQPSISLNIGNNEEEAEDQDTEEDDSEEQEDNDIENDSKNKKDNSSSSSKKDNSDEDSEEEENAEDSKDESNSEKNSSDKKNQNKSNNKSSSGGSKGNNKSENKDSNGRIKFGSKEDEHHHTLEDVIKALEEMNLENVMEKLGLPKSTDIEGIEKKQNMGIDIKNQSIIEADNKRHELSMPSFPGGHMLDCAMERVKSLKKGKLTWKMKVIDEIWGTGLNFKYNNDIISDIYYVDEMIDVIGMNLYLGQITPYKSKDVVAVIIDTSASVGQKDLEDIIPEIIEMQTAAKSGNGAYEVIVFSADTILRGIPIEINADNVNEVLEGGLQIFGRGGTSLTESINQTVESEIFKNKKIRSLIYFTDLGDFPPRIEDLRIDPDMSITYVAVPSINSFMVEGFYEDVKHYAEVVRIKEDEEVDLTITPRIKQDMVIL